jgi:hypothetical protein
VAPAGGVRKLLTISVGRRIRSVFTEVGFVRSIAIGRHGKQISQLLAFILQVPLGTPHPESPRNRVQTRESGFDTIVDFHTNHSGKWVLDVARDSNGSDRRLQCLLFLILRISSTLPRSYLKTVDRRRAFRVSTMHPGHWPSW